MPRRMSRGATGHNFVVDFLWGKSNLVCGSCVAKDEPPNSRRILREKRVNIMEYRCLATLRIPDSPWTTSIPLPILGQLILFANYAGCSNERKIAVTKKRITLRRMLTCLRVALGNLCFLAIVSLSAGPLLACESIETTSSPTQSKESSKTESFVGVQYRLVRIRILWTSAHRLPADQVSSPSRRAVHAAIVGHTLSNELLAPLRC